MDALPGIQELMMLAARLRRDALPGIAVTQDQYDALKATVTREERPPWEPFPSTIAGVEVRIVAAGEPAPEGFKDLRPECGEYIDVDLEIAHICCATAGHRDEHVCKCGAEWGWPR